ncbi:MAG: nitrous oxide reductase family maturation protein NosD [Bacillota bacterium]|nr:nitrous oxide reductase family maturation protein NosD [Bacillota bacterium]
MKKKLLLLFFFSLVSFSVPEKKWAAESLQVAIDSAKEGAVLTLADHTYKGNIVITKKIEIIGSAHTVIQGDGNGNVISIKAPHVKLSHLTVTHSSMNRNSAEEYAGIKIYSNGNTIDHITISDCFHGIYLSQAHHNTISFNNINGMGNGEIAAQGNGLHVYYANNNTLTHNRIEGTRDGMFFEYANHNSIIANTISGTRYGLHYMYSDANDFEKNVFTMNMGGAAVMNSNSIRMKNNQFVFNYGNRSFGLLLLQANHINIEDNLFYLNERGLYIDQSTGNIIRHNRIIQNQIGIELWASSSQQLFTLNRISENTIPAVTLGGKGTDNSWSLHGKGNDWGSTFPLPDLNQNGIGDFPITYRSSLHQLMEGQELTPLFLKSPAIKIYEKINALLQKEDIMFTDPHPLVTGKGNSIPALFLVCTALFAAVILLKGRQWLCIIFGKNGRNR